MRRTHEKLVKALCDVPSVHDGAERAHLRMYFPPEVRAGVAVEGTPRLFAESLVAEGVRRGKLWTVLRWVRAREEGSLPVREALDVAEPLLEREERGLFGIGPDDRHGEELRQELRRALRAVPCDGRVRDAYESALAHWLGEPETPEPVDGWEAYLDLRDIPPDPRGRSPAGTFLYWVAETAADPWSVRAVDRWLDYRERFFGEMARRPSEEPATADDTPPRLVIEVVPDPDGLEQLRVLHWTVTRPLVGGAPFFSPVEELAGIAEQELPRWVSALIARAEARQRRVNHEKLRLEFIFPFSLLFRLPVQHWHLDAPEGVDPPRIGSRYEIIVRSREFARDEGGRYRYAQGSCERRWKLLEQRRHGVARSVSGDDMPPEVNMSEYLGDESIVAFIAGWSGVDWKRQVHAAVYCGIPVVAWCSAADAGDLRPRFRELLACEGEKVGSLGMRKMPTSLYTSRSQATERERSRQSYALSLIYHDCQQTFPDQESELSVGNIQ